MRLREPAAPVAEVSLTSGDPVAGERFVNGVGKCADNIGRERQPAQIDQALQDPGALALHPPEAVDAAVVVQRHPTERVPYGCATAKRSAALPRTKARLICNSWPQMGKTPKHSGCRYPNLSPEGASASLDLIWTLCVASERAVTEAFPYETSAG